MLPFLLVSHFYEEKTPYSLFLKFMLSLHNLSLQTTTLYGLGCVMICVVYHTMFHSDQGYSKHLCMDFSLFCFVFHWMFLKFFLQNAFLQIFPSNVRQVLVYEIPEGGETSMVLSPLCKGVYIAMSAIIEIENFICWQSKIKGK